MRGGFLKAKSTALFSAGTASKRANSLAFSPVRGDSAVAAEPARANMAAKAQAMGRWRFLLWHVAFSPAVFARPHRAPGACRAWAGAERGFPIAANIAVQ